MFTLLIRGFKRFAILIPAFVFGFVAINNILPWLDSSVPFIFAVVATYLLTAYVLIPAGIRFVRIFVRSKHIPVYCTTPDGLASDPINIGLMGSRADVIEAMEAIGWHTADARTPRNILRMIHAFIFDKPYPNAPFSSLFLFGRRQDLGFQMPIDDNPRHRHHVRFWATSVPNNGPDQSHFAFWRAHWRNVDPGESLWVGAASRDVGLALVRHTGQITHMIHFDTDAERELIVSGLESQKLVESKRSVKLGRPYRLTNRTLGGYFHADGRMTICNLIE